MPQGNVSLKSKPGPNKASTPSDKKSGGRGSARGEDDGDDVVASGPRTNENDENDSGDGSDPTAEAQKPAQLSVTCVVRFGKPKIAKTGAGRPLTKSKPQRRIVNIKPGDSFQVYKSSVLAAVKEIATKNSFVLGSLSYDALGLEAKIPKGNNVWRKALAIDNNTAYKDFKQALFKASDRFAESSIELEEDASEATASSEDDFSSSSSSSEAKGSSSKRKRKGKGKKKETTLQAAERLKKQKVNTMKAINELWVCKDDGCNIGGHCLVDSSGKHHPMTKSIKERFVRSICEAGVGTVKDPPSFLFDAEDKPRGRNGPRPSTDRTPQGKGRVATDVTVIFSSPLAAHDYSPGRARATGSKRGTRAPSLKRTVQLPLQKGSAVTTIEVLSLTVNMHPDTTRRLGEAGYMRVTQLARSYEHNFEAFLADFKPTPAMLSDIEDLLVCWASPSAEQTTSRPSPYSKAESSGSADLHDYAFSPRGMDIDLSVPVKKEDEARDMGPSAEARDAGPSAMPIMIGIEDAIVVSDNSSLPASQNADAPQN